MENIEELKNLASQGNQQALSALFDLAIQYLQNRDSKGLDLLQEAAKNGHPKAKEVINNMTAHKPEDHINVINMIKKNAEQGDVKAQFNMGLYYEFGELGLTPDLKEAVKWYKMAISNGLGGQELDMAKSSIASLK